MTVDELRQLTDFEFEYIVQCSDPAQSVLFGVPIPSPFGDGLHWKRTESGSVTITDDIEEWEDAWAAYIDFLQEPHKPPVTEQPQPKRQNRTRKQAAQAGAVTAEGMPEYIANVTLVPYRQAMTVVQNEDARLQPILPELSEKLRFDGTTLYFEGMDASRADLVRYYDNRPQAVTDLDLVTLRALYSIILRDVQNRATTPEQLMQLVTDENYINRMTSIYLSDFLKMTGDSPNTNKRAADLLISKIASYNRILGCIKEEWGGRTYESKYTVLNFDHYDEKTGTLHFYSPYINKLIAMILSSSIQTDRQNRPKLTRSGKPFLEPSHAYNVKATIGKERNRRAVEIVFIIDALIAETGDDHTPHIKARTIVERVPDLQYALDAAVTSSDKSKILRRAFSKAWQLLETQTDLRKNYKNIKFPTNIPTAATLDIVFEFPHDGKVKPNEKKD